MTRHRSGLVVGTTALLLLLATLLVTPGARAGTDPVGSWPLSPEPEVARGFEQPAGPYAAGHRGVDLVGAVGQQVLAALPGTVTFAGSLAGRGVVVVDHGTTRTTYEPVAAGVDEGAVVVAGASLGTLQAGASHCVPRACLHWGWIEGEDTYLDPLRLVGGGPVRLLPLAGLTGTVGPDGLAGPAGLAGVPGLQRSPIAPVALAGTEPVPVPVPVPAAAGVLVALQALGWAWR